MMVKVVRQDGDAFLFYFELGILLLWTNGCGSRHQCFSRKLKLEGRSMTEYRALRVLVDSWMKEK